MADSTQSVFQVSVEVFDETPIDDGDVICGWGEEPPMNVLAANAEDALDKAKSHYLSRTAITQVRLLELTKVTEVDLL